MKFILYFIFENHDLLEKGLRLALSENIINVQLTKVQNSNIGKRQNPQNLVTSEKML
jgi:hypothetical protein